MKNNLREYREIMTIRKMVENLNNFDLCDDKYNIA